MLSLPLLVILKSNALPLLKSKDKKSLRFVIFFCNYVEDGTYSSILIKLGSFDAFLHEMNESGRKISITLPSETR